MIKLLRLDDVMRRSWRPLALASLMFGTAGCGGGPGSFELALDPAAITIAAGTLDATGTLVPGTGQVDVLITCGTNTNLFVITLSLSGVPDEVEIALPPGSEGSAVDCGSADPAPPAAMRISVGEQAPGVYPIGLRGRNFARKDFGLTEPNVERNVTLTLTVQ